MASYIKPILLCCFSGLFFTVTAQRVTLSLDCSEAEKVLFILEKMSTNKPVTDDDWSALFASEPYQKLKAREASIHNPFADSSFKKFVETGNLAAKAGELSKTLREWKLADIQAIGRTVLSYLPAGAVIRAKVFVLIKPAVNSFVWGGQDDRAIYLYLNPRLSKAQFINKVAHESHHIGMESLNNEQERRIAVLSEPQKIAVRWLGGFGEGEAMLAAAGSYKVHPHAADDTAARNQWDKDMSNFNRDLDSLQVFYERILNGDLKTDEAIENASARFLCRQGPWYTVGYRMAALVEQYFGREALVECYVDPRKLLLKYNESAQKDNAKGNNLHLWSTAFLQKLGV